MLMIGEAMWKNSFVFIFVCTDPIKNFTDASFTFNRKLKLVNPKNNYEQINPFFFFKKTTGLQTLSVVYEPVA